MRVTGASAAQAPATNPFAPASAVAQEPGARKWPRGEPTQPVTPAQAAASSAMGAPAQPGAGNGGPWANLSPEERAKRREEFSKLSPEEQAKRREEYRKRREAAAGTSDKQ